jgi:hypothetical protein
MEAILKAKFNRELKDSGSVRARATSTAVLVEGKSSLGRSVAGRCHLPVSYGLVQAAKRGGHVSSFTTGGHVLSYKESGHVLSYKGGGHVFSSKEGGHVLSSKEGGHVFSSGHTAAVFLSHLAETAAGLGGVDGARSALNHNFTVKCPDVKCPTDGAHVVLAVHSFLLRYGGDIAVTETCQTYFRVILTGGQVVPGKIS